MPQHAMTRRAGGFAGAAAVLLVALFVYWPALSGELLWDDPAHVTRAELHGWDGLWRIWFEPGATQQYYPVLHSTFWLEHRLWGDRPVAYHLSNVLLHAANACLLALVVLRLRTRGEVPSDAPKSNSSFATAALAALLFVVHPVSVESVAWITEQKNTLSTAFYFSAALVFLRFEAGRAIWAYALALLLYLLALGTKTTTATLPAALLVVLWWKNNRLGWRRDVLPLLPWFAAAIPAGLVTAAVERTLIGADLVVPDLSLPERTLLAARVLWFYLGKLVWPDVTFFYPLWDVAEQSTAWVGYLLAALVVTTGLWLLRRRSRTPLAIWLLYGGTLFPALGFFKVFPFQYSYVADHFQYLALPAAMTGIAGAAVWLVERAPSLLRRVAPAGAAAVVLVLAFLSRAESALYRNDEVLFRANVTENPTSWMGYHILAQRIGKTPERRSEAIALFRRSLELNPKAAETYGAFGGLLVTQPGHSAEAIALFEEAIRLRPTYAEAHNALANELVAQPNRLAEAVEHYEIALQLRPDFALAEANLAMALAQMPNRKADALRHFEQALARVPDYAPAHFHLARLLAEMTGRERDSVAHYESALALRPQSDEARVELAVVLMRLGRDSEAARHVEEALRLRPDNLLALNLRGIMSAQAGRPDEARAAWRRALEIAPNFEPARRNLQRLDAGSAR